MNINPKYRFLRSMARTYDRPYFTLRSEWNPNTDLLGYAYMRRNLLHGPLDPIQKILSENFAPTSADAWFMWTGQYTGENVENSIIEKTAQELLVNFKATTKRSIKKGVIPKKFEDTFKPKPKDSSSDQLIYKIFVWNYFLGSAERKREIQNLAEAARSSQNCFHLSAESLSLIKYVITGMGLVAAIALTGSISLPLIYFPVGYGLQYSLQYMVATPVLEITKFGDAMLVTAIGMATLMTLAFTLGLFGRCLLEVSEHLNGRVSVITSNLGTLGYTFGEKIIEICLGPGTIKLIKMAGSNELRFDQEARSRKVNESIEAYKTWKATCMKAQRGEVTRII